MKKGGFKNKVYSCLLLATLLSNFKSLVFFVAPLIEKSINLFNRLNQAVLCQIQTPLTPKLLVLDRQSQ